MVSADTKSVIERAKRLYAAQLQAVLEAQHANRFVAIEPESGEYFLGDTFDEAVKSARAKHPSRLSHTIHIGHRAAFHIGACNGEPGATYHRGSRSTQASAYTHGDAKNKPTTSDAHETLTQPGSCVPPDPFLGNTLIPIAQTTSPPMRTAPGISHKALVPAKYGSA